MQATAGINKREIERLRKNLIEYVAVSGRELGDQVRQRSLNVAGRTFDNIKPQAFGEGLKTRRHQIKVYMDAMIATRLKIAKSGKRKGKFMRKGGRKKQLTRAVLILQARRKKEGKKGLYGKEMRYAVGSFVGISQKAVGALKVGLIPIIRALNPICKFKFPFYKTRSFAQWKNGYGFGKVSLNSDKMHPKALMEFGANVKTNDAKVQAIYEEAANRAIWAENIELERHMKARLQKMAQKFNSAP
jgi:hypothetical protein